MTVTNRAIGAPKLWSEGGDPIAATLEIIRYKAGRSGVAKMRVSLLLAMTGLKADQLKRALDVLVERGAITFAISDRNVTVEMVRKTPGREIADAEESLIVSDRVRAKATIMSIAARRRLPHATVIVVLERNGLLTKIDRS